MEPTEFEEDPSPPENIEIKTEKTNFHLASDEGIDHAQHIDGMEFECVSHLLILCEESF